MKILLIILSISVPLLASDFAIQQKTAFYGGLSLAVGDWSEAMNPGINTGLESVASFKNIYGIGGSLEYTWLSIDFPASFPKNAKGSIHYWNLSVIQKLYIHIYKNLTIFGEFSSGFYLGIATVRMEFYSNTETEPDFGLSFGTGFSLKYFLFVFNVKVVFTEDESTKWITLSVGFSG